jgi:ribosomal protein L40E
MTGAERLRNLKTLDEKQTGNWFPIASKNGIENYCTKCGAKLPPSLQKICLSCFTLLTTPDKWVNKCQ